MSQFSVDTLACRFRTSVSILSFPSLLSFLDFSSPFVASFPGLPTVQFLIACSKLHTGRWEGVASTQATKAVQIKVSRKIRSRHQGNHSLATLHTDSLSGGRWSFSIMGLEQLPWKERGRAAWERGYAVCTSAFSIALYKKNAFSDML